MGAREGSVSRGGGKEGSAKRELVQVKGFVRIFSHIMLDAKKRGSRDTILTGIC